MSRSYRILAIALVGMLVLVGLAKVVGRETTSASSADTSSQAATITTLAEQASESTAAEGVVTDEADGDQATTSTLAPAVTAACSITTVLKSGASGAEVQCLESQLVAAGFTTTVDTTFDTATDTAVKAYQAAKSLEADGIVGRVTAQAMASGPARSARCRPRMTTARARRTVRLSTAPTSAARCVPTARSPTSSRSRQR